MKHIFDSLPKIKPIMSEHDLINLNEHLRSLTIDEVLYHLQYKYDKNIQPTGKYTDNVEQYSPFLISIPIGFVNSTTKKQEFIDYLDKLMWYITDDFGMKAKKWTVGIEPVESTNVTGWVHTHKYIYHITSKSRTQNEFCPDTVTNIGLRPRSSSYRYFPNRVHFICPDNEVQFNEQINKLMDQLRIPKGELRIFRMDLSKINKNIQFYHDGMYDEQNYIYAFVKFPWTTMEEIKI